MAERDDESKEHELDKHQSKETDENDIENLPENIDIETSTKPEKQRKILAVALASVLLLGIIPLVYFQFDFGNDSDPLKKPSQESADSLSPKYGVGGLGSEHVHAALVVFVNGEKINFGLPQFQLQSSYIHFENKNPYLVHRHATGVPLAMLFDSIGMKITQDCIILNNDESQDSGFMKNRYCSGDETGKILRFYVNGITYNSGIAEYVLDHEDRVLISFGEDSEKIIEDQIDYLSSLRIYDIPEEDRQQREPSSNISI